MLYEFKKGQTQEQRLKFYEDFAANSREIREVIVAELRKAGHNPLTICEYMIVADEPETIFTADWKKALVFDFHRLNHVWKQEVMRELNPIYASRGGDPQEAESEVFKWAEREGKLSAFRHLVNNALRSM